MTQDADLLRRIDRIESRFAIAALCTAYARACDDREIDKLGDMFAEDADTSGLLEAFMKARSVGEGVVEPAVGAIEPEIDPRIAAIESAGVTAPSLEAAAVATPAAKSKRAGAKYSAQKPAGTRKAATASRPGTKSRRPSK